MFRLTIIDGTGRKATTVAISGSALFSDARELEQALGQLLAGCDHLTIDICGVQDVDVTFRALICVLHRHSELLHKKISLQGALSLRGDPLFLSNSRRCFRKPDQCCHLWDVVLPGPGDGRWLSEPMCARPRQQE
jgi:ABC-type transporter Mla MlaB component